MRHEVTVEIAAEPAAVWQVLSDVTRWSEWLVTVTALEALDGPLRVGHRFRLTQPRTGTAVWEVTEHEPGSSFAWATRFAGGRMVGTHRVAAAGDGSTVTVGIDYRGGLARLLEPLVGKRIREFVDIEAASLTRRCEDGD